MPADRTKEFFSVASKCIDSLQLPKDKFNEAKQRLILRPKPQKTQFTAAANDLLTKIGDLNQFIKSSQATYLSPALSNVREKKAIEDEVELRVASCTQIVETLKRSTLAAAGRGGDSEESKGPAGINGHFEAHLHGIAFILALRVGKAAAAFDRLRVARDAQEAATGRVRSQQMGKVHVEGIWLAAEKSHITPGAGAGLPPPPPPPSQMPRILGSSSPSQSQASQIKTLKNASDNEELLRLLTTTQAVPHVESAARELAALNRILATAAIEQAEQIETLYTNALEATTHLEAGNISLRRARKVQRSSTRLAIAVILTLTLCLLFYDWFEG